MIARTRYLVAALAGLMVMPGCACKQKCSYCPPPGCPPRGAPVVVPGNPVPVAPAFQPIPPAQPALVPANPAPVQVPPQALRPADVRAVPPEPVVPEIRMRPPQIVEAPPPVPEAPRATLPEAPPPASDARDIAATPTLDIPGFALAKTRVATGLKPFPDGVAWLQAQGYRTVVHLRRPGDSDKAVQQQFENKGLHYQALEVAPEALTREVVDSFTKIVNDSANYPVYVFDADGALTGGLWLIYFRLFEGVSEEKAFLEAARLGFKKDQDGTHHAMAEAVSRYLSQHP